VSTAFDVADAMLARLLNNWRTVNGSLQYYCALYKNDYTPVPGTTTGSFVWADYPGYMTLPFLVSGFPPATVTNHVATLTLDHQLTFNASASGSFEQTLYGYVVFDDAYNYAWAERFTTPFAMTAAGYVNITPRFREAVCTGSMSTLSRRRSAAANV